MEYFTEAFDQQQPDIRQKLLLCFVSNLLSVQTEDGYNFIFKNLISSDELTNLYHAIENYHPTLFHNFTFHKIHVYNS